MRFAADENFIVLPHDVRTLVNDAYKRIKQKLPMPGVILVPNTLAVGTALNDLEIVIGAGPGGAARGNVSFPVEIQTILWVNRPHAQVPLAVVFSSASENKRLGRRGGFRG